jgi:hypothetical protein
MKIEGRLLSDALSLEALSRALQLVPKLNMELKASLPSSQKPAVSTETKPVHNLLVSACLSPLNAGEEARTE